MMHRYASVAIAVQAHACLGLRTCTVRPLLPAQGAQPALNLDGPSQRHFHHGF